MPHHPETSTSAVPGTSISDLPAWSTPAAANPAPIPDFTAEIADAWAKLRELSDEDLGRVEAWFGATREGRLNPYLMATTAEHVAQLALELHESGRRAYALKKARERFRFGPPAHEGQEAMLRAGVIRVNPRQCQMELAETALGIATRLLGDQSDQHVPGACRLLRLAIAHAAEA